MRLKSIEIAGFKSFAKKTELKFDAPVTAIVGPNGSGKSNIAESFRFALGEQSVKSMRGKRGEDLIWSGSHAAPRANRASVRMVLDNADRALGVDFDEVVVERAVHRDGAGEYRINNSPARLRDIAQLLARAGVGSSGHHIISQGEADRALSCSVRERRGMLEDALGLTAYLSKREEAEKKMEKTRENMREVEALRRELAPHLKFLDKQVRKIEETEKMREELCALCRDYFARERIYTQIATARIARERMAPEREKLEQDAIVLELRSAIQAAQAQTLSPVAHELGQAEASLARARQEGEKAMRELGRVEGELSAHEALQEREQGSVPAADMLSLGERIVTLLETAVHGDLQALRSAAETALIAAREVVARAAREMRGAQEAVRREDILARKKALEEKHEAARAQEQRAVEEVQRLRAQLEAEKDAGREAQQKLLSAQSRSNELEHVLSRFQSQAQEIERDKQVLTEDVRAAAVVLGVAAFDHEHYRPLGAYGQELADEDVAHEARGEQLERRRKVERLKIRLEESGAGNTQEIIKEHRDTSERDQFLERELADLSASIVSLQSLVGELTETLHQRFDDGLANVSAQFNEFFKLVFGGGEASLVVIKKERGEEGSLEGELDNDTSSSPRTASDSDQGGVDIAVSLPHKRVKGLAMLSGGERALTSIALIFAMSQINPPPFLILDETDAALDEANARRYGDMIELLAKRSQLIVITHNRETMSHAGVLYGVTMGSDGASKILSVRFEEAAAVAK